MGMGCVQRGLYISMFLSHLTLQSSVKCEMNVEMWYGGVCQCRWCLVVTSKWNDWRCYSARRMQAPSLAATSTTVPGYFWPIVHLNTAIFPYLYPDHLACKQKSPHDLIIDLVRVCSLRWLSSLKLAESITKCAVVALGHTLGIFTVKYAVFSVEYRVRGYTVLFWKSVPA